jgi:uncharacterized protein (DUF433 family)
MTGMTLLDRITFDPKKCGGKPCVRGLRITVSDVLELLADDLTPSEVVKQLPDLEPDDVRACITYAAQRIDHPTLVAK